MTEKQKKTEPKPIQELEIGVIDTKILPPEAELQPNSLQFRIEISRRPPIGKVLPLVAAIALLLSLAGLSLALRFNDKFREDSLVAVKQLNKDAKSQKFNKVTRPLLANVAQALRAHRPPKALIAADPVTESFTTCSAFITNTINKKVKAAVLTEDEFIYLINCQLFQDSPSAAFQALEKKHISIAVGNSWETMRVHLLALETHRRMNPMSPLPIFPKQGCLRFAATPDCLMRFFDESHASFKSRWQDGFKALEKDIHAQSGSVQAWFYLASGLYANKDREFAKADEYLQSAFNAIKDMPNPYLEREIYRNATLNAFMAKDPTLANSALAMMPLKRVEEAPNAFLDTELLEQLRGKDSTELLREYLTRGEAVLRFAHDSRFLSIVLLQTQRTGLEQEGLAFASKVFGKAIEAKADAIGEIMVLTYARMWIGAGKHFEALEMLTQMEKAGYRSPELYHLKGLAQLYSFKKVDGKLLAAKDLQTAAGLNKNEESLFALLVALLDAKERTKADQVMNQWKTLGPAAQKSSWYGFAQGLLSYTGGKKEEAKSLWLEAEKINKNSFIWSKLKSNLEGDPTWLDRDVARNLYLLLGNDSALGSLALSSQKS